MMRVVFTDQDISRRNYHSFKGCEIGASGKEITFVYACGVQYTVPIDYLAKWFYGPHRIMRNGRWQRVLENKLHIKRSKRLRFSNWRRLTRSLEGWKGIVYDRVRLYFNDGTSNDLAYDTLLMTCEPRYELFGGLCDESKRITSEWFSHPSNKIRTKILHRDITDANFGSFKSCVVVEEGTALLFTMACGDKYELPVQLIENLPQAEPVRALRAGVSPNICQNSIQHRQRINASKCKCLPGKTVVRAYLDDGQVRDIGWEVVLRLCDERYEHYEGLPEV
jgi:hypothetical protein